LFGYSKQAYYKFKFPIETTEDQAKLLKAVLQIRSQLPRCGVRKLHYLLQKKADHVPIGRDRLFSFLRTRGLLVSKRKKYHKTTNSKHWMKKYPNLIKDLAITHPEQLWVADITYLESQQKHYYLHLITDAYSKKIVGYTLSDNMLATTTLKALKQAINSRKYTSNLIHHSDRGLQYSSAIYTQRLIESNIKISMTEQSDPYENAIAERVNGILKDEFGLDESFENYELMEKQVTQSIAIYNQLRPHLSIEMMTPNEAHKQPIINLKTWKQKMDRQTCLPIH
jgi:transposase InsO family protein